MKLRLYTVGQHAAQTHSVIVFMSLWPSGVIAGTCPECLWGLTAAAVFVNTIRVIRRAETSRGASGGFRRSSDSNELKPFSASDTTAAAAAATTTMMMTVVTRMEFGDKPEKNTSVGWRLEEEGGCLSVATMWKLLRAARALWHR